MGSERVVGPGVVLEALIQASQPIRGSRRIFSSLRGSRGVAPLPGVRCCGAGHAGGGPSRRQGLNPRRWLEDFGPLGAGWLAFSMPRRLETALICASRWSTASGPARRTCSSARSSRFAGALSLLGPALNTSILFALGKDPAHVMTQLGHTDAAFTLRAYAREMDRRDGEPDRLRALVQGGEVAPGGTTGSGVPAPSETAETQAA